MLYSRYDIFGAKDLADAKFEGRFEFPVTPGIDLEETDEVHGIPFDRIDTDLERSGVFLHFYVHDRRFVRRFMERREKWLDDLRYFAGVIGMDNSVYRDLPFAEQIHSLYLNRAMDYWLWRKGIRVVPNVSWGDERLADFCFDGIARGATVALSTHGAVRSAVDRAYLYDHLVRLRDVLRPRKVVWNGALPAPAREMLAEVGIEIVRMPSRMDVVFRRKGGRHG